MTPGQAAYERDLLVTPHYPDGMRRPSWVALSEIAQWSWEKNPTDRNAAILEAICDPTVCDGCGGTGVHSSGDQCVGCRGSGRWYMPRYSPSRNGSRE